MHGWLLAADPDALNPNAAGIAGCIFCRIVPGQPCAADAADAGKVSAYDFALDDEVSQAAQRLIVALEDHRLGRTTKELAPILSRSILDLKPVRFC